MANKTGMPPPPQQLEKQREKSSKQAAREAARKRQQMEQRRNLLLIIAGVAVVGIIAVILIGNAARSGGGIARSGKGATLGAADAPVVLQDFSDFYCSHCRDFALDRAPELVKTYVDKGLLRIEFKHFPLRDSSYSAHIAAECAAGQDKFWEYHDVLYKNQQGSELSNAQLKKFALDLGLDTTAFDTCLDNKQGKAQVDADAAEGQAKQINSTPTMFINNERVLGAVSVAQFEEVINRKLQEKGVTPPG